MRFVWGSVRGIWGLAIRLIYDFDELWLLFTPRRSHGMGFLGIGWGGLVNTHISDEGFSYLLITDP